jgi:surface protein
MFRSAASFNGDLSNWDVSNVKYMSGMFERAFSFNGDISKWDVSNVKDMSHMFERAESFNGDISKWDVSNVKYMHNMFDGAVSYKGDNEGTLRKKAANWNRRKNALIALQDVKTSRVLSLLDLKRYIVSYL